MPFQITTKLLGVVSGGLAITSAALGDLLWLQTERLAASDLAFEAASTSNSHLVSIANQRAQDLKGRDLVIQAQTNSITALQDQASANRAVYLQGIARANAAAKTHETRASSILRLPTPPVDEACEAARALLEEELVTSSSMPSASAWRACTTQKKARYQPSHDR